MPTVPPSDPGPQRPGLPYRRRPPGTSAILILLVIASCVPSRDPEATAVREVARMYLLADQEGDHRRLLSVLHSRAEAWSVQADGREVVTAAPAVRLHAPGGRVRMGEAGESRILAVDVHGTAAMVKAELRVEGGRFTEYLTLLKLEEGWRIVGSSSHWEEDRERRSTGG